MTDHIQDERYELLKTYVARTGLGMLILALLTIALVALMVYTGLVLGQWSDMTRFGTIMGVFFLVLFAIVGVGALVVWTRGLSRKSVDHPVLRAVTHPEERLIVWFHHREIHASKMRPAHLIYFYKRDGKGVSITVSPNHVEPLLTYPAEALPYARVGYSDGAKAAYKKDPTSLLS
ncbi:MAG: hypothetical protein MI724_08840 [Spirochaetales bacterium]|nr:hypothetical protein [Spirochaetales bacterium]